MDNRQTERTPQKCFRCGSEDHLIEKCPKPPKENEKWRIQVRFNEKGNFACDNSENNNDQKIYTSMACISGNYEFPRENFDDISQLTYLILYYRAMYHITPEVSGFHPG